MIPLTRMFESFIAMPVVIIASMIVVILGIAGSIAIGESKVVRRVCRGRDPTFVLVMLYLAVVCVLGIIFESEVQALVPRLTGTARVVAGTLFLVTLASALFALKVTRLRIYAGLELMFGVAVATHTISTFGDTVEPIQSLGLLTSAYLIIRGLDNFKRDRDERKKTGEAAQVR